MGKGREADASDDEAEQIRWPTAVRASGRSIEFDRACRSIRGDSPSRSHRARRPASAFLRIMLDHPLHPRRQVSYAGLGGHLGGLSICLRAHGRRRRSRRDAFEHSAASNQTKSTRLAEVEGDRPFWSSTYQRTRLHRCGNTYDRSSRRDSRACDRLAHDLRHAAWGRWRQAIDVEVPWPFRSKHEHCRTTRHWRPLFGSECLVAAGAEIHGVPAGLASPSPAIGRGGGVATAQMKRDQKPLIFVAGLFHNVHSHSPKHEDEIDPLGV